MAEYPVPLKQLTISGLNSIRAIAEHSPQLIERLYFDETAAPQFAEVCSQMARARKTYRLVTTEELRKISESTHHQGVAAVIDEPDARSLSEFSPDAPVLCLYDVLNPHNVGAILRTAAFFGIEEIVMSGQTFAAAQTQAAWRVAEGGLSYVKLYACQDAREFFAWIKARGLRALAAVKPDLKSRRTLGEFLRDSNKSPAVICLGNEEDGLPESFVASCAGRFSFTGSGKIESLNVSVTAALCLAELKHAQMK